MELNWPQKQYHSGLTRFGPIFGAKLALFILQCSCRISGCFGCLSAMLSFGTCNGNRGGFTVCAVKNNLGILEVVFILKRTRFELPFICCGGHFRKQMYGMCMCFQDYYYARRRKNVSSVAVLTRDLELPRSNRKREYAAWTLRLNVSYSSNGKR